MDRSGHVGPDEDCPLIQLKPVGVVRNQSRDAFWGEKLGALNLQARAARMREQRETVSEVIVNADVEGALDGIDGYSHLIVLFWPHMLPEEKRHSIRVHPMGCRDLPMVGVFATRSPGRPNPVLTTVVRLLERNGNTLRVTGLDALDGSPVLDIKPYLPERDPLKDVRLPGWMRRLRREFGTTDESPGGRPAGPRCARTSES